MEYFDIYVQELLDSFKEINYVRFLINLVVTGVLASLLGLFYVRFGNSPNNRRRFSLNFLPLAMTTMLIIFIVKSSVALSLGLVGALSIVRFRSAIKEPEELTYLFLTIGIGLAAGADEILIAIIAFLFVTAILLVQALLRGRGVFSHSDNMLLNISTTNKDLAGITKSLGEVFSFVELKRIDEGSGRLDASFNIEANSIAQIEEAKQKLVAMDQHIIVSFVEQRNIAV